MAASRGFQSLYVGLGAGAAIALLFVWSYVIPTSPLPRESTLPAAEVALPLPAPAPQAMPIPAPLVPPSPPTPPTPAAPEATVAAVPPAPSAVPAVPPEPLLVDRRTIARVQFFLEQLGYQVGAADGAMGRRTRTAIAAFRATNALPKGEEIDGQLFDALDLAVRQLPPKPADGVPAAAPRIPVVRVPLAN